MVLNKPLQLTGDFHTDWNILEREMFLLMSEYSRLTFIADAYPSYLPDKDPSEVSAQYTYVASEVILPMLRKVQELCRTTLRLDDESYEDLCGDWLESQTLYSAEANESFEEKVENLRHNHGYVAISYLQSMEMPLGTFLKTGEVTNMPGVPYGRLVFLPLFTHLKERLVKQQKAHDADGYSLWDIYELLNQEDDTF